MYEQPVLVRHPGRLRAADRRAGWRWNGQRRVPTGLPREGGASCRPLCHPRAIPDDFRRCFDSVFHAGAFMSFKSRGLALALGAVLSMAALGALAQATTQVTMYYPVSVGGPLTAGGGQAGRPVPAGQPGRQGQRHLRRQLRRRPHQGAGRPQGGGTPVQTSVLFSIDLFEAEGPERDRARSTTSPPPPEDKAWLAELLPGPDGLTARADGKTWGIPFQRSTIVMFYNKDAFKLGRPGPEQAAAHLDRDGARPPPSW